MSNIAKRQSGLVAPEHGDIAANTAMLNKTQVETYLDNLCTDINTEFEKFLPRYPFHYPEVEVISLPAGGEIVSVVSQIPIFDGNTGTFTIVGDETAPSGYSAYSEDYGMTVPLSGPNQDGLYTGEAEGGDIVVTARISGGDGSKSVVALEPYCVNIVRSVASTPYIEFTIPEIDESTSYPSRDFIIVLDCRTHWAENLPVLMMSNQVNKFESGDLSNLRPVAGAYNLYRLTEYIPGRFVFHTLDNHFSTEKIASLTSTVDTLTSKLNTIANVASNITVPNDDDVTLRDLRSAVLLIKNALV